MQRNSAVLHVRRCLTTYFPSALERRQLPVHTSTSVKRNPTPGTDFNMTLTNVLLMIISLTLIIIIMISLMQTERTS